MSEILDAQKLKNKTEELIKTLQAQLGFLLKCEDTPMLIFDEAASQLGNSRSYLLTLLDSTREDTFKCHQFQYYIENIAQRGFQQWMEEQHIKENLTIKLRDPHCFPTIFAVYWDGREMVQFDIYKQFYGVRNVAMTQSDFESRIHSFQGNLDSIKDHINFYKGEIRKISPYLSPTISLGRGLKEKIQIYKHSEMISQKTKEKIDLYESLIEKEKDELANCKREEDAYRNRIEKEKEMVNLIFVFFQQHNYRLETEKSKLY